jgi:excisionase family DNA binding protein
MLMQARKRRRAAPVVPPITLRWLAETSWQPTWSPAEVAAALGVSVWTVRRWIREGVLPATRLPGSNLLRVRVADVQAQMVDGKEKP